MGKEQAKNSFRFFRNAHTGFQGGCIQCELILEPKARPMAKVFPKRMPLLAELMGRCSLDKD
jgi:hypothetical protein